MAPSIKVALPRGEIGVDFNGDGVPVVSSVAATSPMQGKLKPGYKFVALILGDGTEFMELGTMELLDALGDTAEEEGRKIKLQIALPSETTVTIPPGETGITVGGDPPTIVQVDSTSRLKDKLRVGLVVDSMELEDGYAISGHTAEEIADMLKVNEGGERTLILKDPNSSALSDRAIKFPVEREIAIPAGELGVAFEGSPAKVVKISHASPVRSKFRIGMIADSLLMPDGTEYSGFSADQLTGILSDCVGVEGRKIVLKPPTSGTLSKTYTTKVILPSGDLGLDFDGEPAVITKVPDESLLKDRLYAGQMVKSVCLDDGTEYDDLDCNDVKEILNHTKDSSTRWMLLENRKPIIPFPGEKMVYLPAARLGVNFDGKPPIVAEVAKTSPVANEFMVGLVADTLIVPGHPTYIGVTSNELTRILNNTVAIQGRVIRLKNPARPSDNRTGEAFGSHEADKEPAKQGDKRPSTSRSERNTKKARRSNEMTGSLYSSDEEVDLASKRQGTVPGNQRKTNAASTWAKKRCTSMLKNVLKNFDPANRPANIRPSTSRPSRPASRDDLSDSALAFTEPKGSFPVVDRGTSITCFIKGGPNSLIEFMDKARKLNPRTPAAIMEMLSASNSHECSITEDYVRHLFRNFVDIEVIGGVYPPTGMTARIDFSLREIEIMLYCALNDFTLAECLELIPYRSKDNIRSMWKTIESSVQNAGQCPAYKAHVEQTVGMLFELENEATAFITNNDTGNSVEAKMKSLGWECVNGSGLDNYYYIAPGGKHPREGGILDQDFVKEVFGLKKYAYDHLGWGGDEAFLKEMNDMKSQKKPPRKPASKAHSASGPKKIKVSSVALDRREQERKEGNLLSVVEGHPDNKQTVMQKLEACKDALGLANNTVTFSYHKEGLIKIVEDRVGNTIIDPKAIEFVARKVAATSGEVHEVLEITSNAVAKCLESLSSEERNDTSLDQPIVSLKFMLKAVKDTIQNVADLIEGLPDLAKIILCIAVSLNSVEQVSSEMSVGMLRHYVFEALDDHEIYGEKLTIDVFFDLIQQLYDSGLMLAGTAEPFDVAFANLYSQPIRLGVQLQDVESVIGESLGQQDMYRRIMNRARNARRA